MPLAKKQHPDEMLADALADFYDDPLGYVMFCFPWDSNSSLQLVELPEEYQEKFGCRYGPDDWAIDFLEDLGKDVKDRGFDGTEAVDAIQYSTVSGHGIGKSTLVAWLIKWILDTRPFSKGVVTAGTAEQLKTKTWAELGKWHKMSLTEHWYNYTAGRGAMAIAHKEYPEQWRCDAQTCKEENSEAFAGLHAAAATPFYIFDEASQIPDKIWEVRLGGLSDGSPMTFDFGNGTRNSGYFFENCVGKYKHRYNTRSIDSRDVKITNKKLWQQLIDDYGEDSDVVKVRVRGMFPSAGDMQFIPMDLVEEAQYRPAVDDPTAPLIIGVDVARYGDDSSVIYPRIGYDARSFAPKRFNGLSTTQLVGQVISVINEFEQLGRPVDALFVDGTGIGGGVVDQLNDLGYNPIEVQFGSKPIDADTYRYKGDEIWGRLKDALPRMALPKETDHGGIGAELRDGLTQREFGYTLTGNKIHLETKRDMKKRGLSSPDLPDALAITFAEDVVPAAKQNKSRQQFAQHDYDPLEGDY